MRRLLVPFSYALLLLCGCHSRPDKDALVVDIESTPNNLDVRIGTDAQSEHVGALIFEALVKKDAQYHLQPWLAERWEWRDAKTLAFYIRPGVKFHDGSPLTAADAAWSIESMISGKLVTSKAGNFANVESAVAEGPMTCVLHLKRPDVGVLFNLSDGLSGIVKEGAGAHSPLIGTGPFRFVSEEVDKEIRLDRFDGYWRAPAHVKHLRIAIVPDDTTRALEVRKGSADVVSNALRFDTVYALQHDHRVVVETAPGSILYYINMSLRDPDLKDRRVRQALAYALDRPAMIAALLRGEARLANTLLPTGHWAAGSDAEVPPYSYNPARAQQLLDEAGYKPDARGVRLRLTLKTSTDDTTRLIAAVVQQQFRAVGVQLELRTNEFATFYSDVTKGAFQLYILRWLGANEDPDIFRYAYASTSFPPKGANRGFFSNAVGDKLIAQGSSERDDTARRETYVRLEQLIQQEEPTINLWYLNNVVVHTARVRNVHPTSSGTFDFLTTAEIAE